MTIIIKKNQKVKVSLESKYHAGKVGYLNFLGEGPSKGTAVLTHEPDIGQHILNMFAVDVLLIQPIDM